MRAIYRFSVAPKEAAGDDKTGKNTGETLLNRTNQPPNMLQQSNAFWIISEQVWKKIVFGACNPVGNALSRELLTG